MLEQGQKRKKAIKNEEKEYIEKYDGSNPRQK